MGMKPPMDEPNPGVRNAGNVPAKVDRHRPVRNMSVPPSGPRGTEMDQPIKNSSTVKHGRENRGRR